MQLSNDKQLKKKRKWILYLSFIVSFIILILLYKFLFNSEEKKFIENDDYLNSVATILLVENVDSSVAFYKKYFGFAEYKRFPFEGRATLAVVEYKRLYVMFQDKDVFKENKKKFIGGNIEPSFSLYVDYKGAKELYEQIKDILEIVQEYQLMFYDRYEFSVKDLDGHIITFSDDVNN
jgi:uncharacterized glyoxalase superfamily protein PhnB